MPVRNEASLIASCLAGIRAQTYPAQLIEVIVVDGESTDTTVTVVREAAAADRRVRLISNPARSMPTGLNLGIGAATGEFIGVVSGHSVLPRDYLERVVEASIRTGAWSVGGSIVRRGETRVQRAIAIATARAIGVGDSVHNYASEAGWVDTVFPGFWRRDLFGRIGLFDPDMVANEDNELSLRIRRAGGQIWFDPDIRVGYVPRSTLGGLFNQYRSYGLGKMRVLRKHRGGLRLRNFVPAAWVAWLVAGAAVVAFMPAAGPIWMLGIAVYLASIVTAGLRLGKADAPGWLIAIALATIHLGYGLGTWQGLATWRSRAPRT